MKMIGAVLGAASLLVLHGTEEYVTGLYEVDPLFKRVAASLPFDAHFEFLAYQFILWGLLAALIYHLNQGRKMSWATY